MTLGPRTGIPAPRSVPAQRVLHPGATGPAALLQLQREAGNKAVTMVIQATRTKTKAKPPAGAKKPRSPIYDMPYSEVEGQLAKVRMHLAQQTDQTSKLSDFLRARIASLERRKAALAREEGALTSGKGKGKGKKAKQRDPKDVPASLTMPAPLLAIMPGFDAGKEVDAIHAYLRAGATKVERKRLADALRVLKRSSDAEVEAKVNADRRAKVDRRLQALYGDEADQLEQLAKIMDSIQRDPAQPDLMWLPNGSERIPVGAAEVRQLQSRFNTALVDATAQVRDTFDKAFEAWDARHTTNKRHKVVHGIVRWYTGTKDITAADMDSLENTSRGLRGLVKTKATAGQYARAVHFLFVGQAHAQGVANRIAEWDSSLVGGAAWLTTCLTVLKEGLTLLATAGAAGIVRSGAHGALTVFGASAGAGGVAAGGASVLDQVSSGEGVSAAKTGGAIRVGTGEGMAIGGGALADKAFKVAGATTKTGAAIRSIGSGTALDVASAGVKGDSMKDAAVGSIAGGAVSHTIKGIGKGGKAVEVAADMAAGGVKAVAAGGDAKDVAKGVALGGAGNIVGGAVTNHRAHDPSTGATGGTGGADPLAPTIEVPDAPTAVDPRSAAEVSGAPEAYAPTVPSSRGDVDSRAPTVEVPHAPTAQDPRPAPGVGGGDPHAPTSPAGAGGTMDSAPPGSPAAAPGRSPAGTAGTVGTADGADAGPVVAAPNPKRPEGPLPPGKAEYEVLRPNEQLTETPHGTWDDIDLPSVPRGAEYKVLTGSVKDLGPPPGGLSAATGSRKVEIDGQEYIFKPASAEVHVNRASARGVRSGEYGPRAKAAAELAGDQGLGVGTPDVELVVINGKKGTLTKWVKGGRTLKDIAKSDPGEYQRIVASPEYQKAQAAIDAFDYLINNLDRNGGNLIVQLDASGKVSRLVPIDHDLAFTSTAERAVMKYYANDMPTEFSAETIRRLQHMSANRQQLADALGPLIGWDAVPGTMQRLDKLLAAANAFAVKHHLVGAGAATP